MSQGHRVEAGGGISLGGYKEVALSICRSIKNTGVGVAFQNLGLGRFHDVGLGSIGLPFPADNFHLGGDGADLVQNPGGRLELETNALKVSRPFVAGKFAAG